MKDDGGRGVETLRKLEDNVAPTFVMHGEMSGGLCIANLRVSQNSITNVPGDMLL